MATSKESLNAEIQFVDGPLKDSNCPICLQLLKDPFLTGCCGHHFCNEYIGSVRQQKNECPICKSWPITGIINKRFKREINEAQVYCPLRPQGCEWTGEYGNLRTHLSVGQQYGQCKHVVVNCPNNNCNMKFPRHDIKRHANKECDYRPFMCPHCSYKDIFLFIEQHHLPECPSYPVACPNNCTRDKIKRSQMHKHFGVCPNAMVSCSFSEVGCKVKLKRRNLKKHNESNIDQHQTFISTAIAKLQKEDTIIKDICQVNYQKMAAQLESKISVLEKKCFQLEQNLFKATEKETDKLVEELVKIVPVYYQELKDGLSGTQKENQQLRSSLRSLQLKYNSLETEIEELKSVFSATCKENKQLKSRVTSLEARFCPVETEVSELQTKLATTESEMKQILQGHLEVDPSEIQLPQYHNTDQWINCYKKVADKMKRLNWKLYLTTMAETATRFPDAISPVIIKFTGYRKQIKLGNSIRLQTSPFYSTGAGKYKFMLIIQFNMNSISILARITRGDYDDHVTWPFVGSITVTLLNQLENKDHYSRQIWSSYNKPGLAYTRRVPLNHTHNPGFGMQYISHEELEDSPQGFVLHDCMYFEVHALAQNT